jgi:hypothetical protein
VEICSLPSRLGRGIKLLVAEVDEDIWPRKEIGSSSLTSTRSFFKKILEDSLELRWFYIP